MNQKGKFIIIEGTDGSGKTTQLGLLKECLEKNGKKVKTLDFPQYEEFWGKTVGRFLKGDFGELDEVNPYLASLPYMLDQSSQSKQLNEWLDSGYTVLSNRYVTSSMAHQTCKFKEEKEQDEYLSWLTHAAYEELGLVKEDVTIVLYALPEISKTLSQESRARKSNYTSGKDIAEDHENHIKDSAEMYTKLCDVYESWDLINCMNGNEIDSIGNIHQMIIRKLGDLI